MASGAMADLSETSFSAPDWLQHFPLNADTVMDYFALSQFYDRTCNNEVLKMQRRHGQAAATGAAEQLSLRQMEGLEYEVGLVNEPYLFVIKKQRRSLTKDGAQVLPLATYHVINGNIFQAPTLSAILTSRLQSSMREVDAAFRLVVKAVQFAPTTGYQWKDAVEKRSSSTATPGEASKTASQAPSVMPKAYEDLLRLLDVQTSGALVAAAAAAAAAAATAATSTPAKADESAGPSSVVPSPGPTPSTAASTSVVDVNTPPVGTGSPAISGATVAAADGKRQAIKRTLQRTDSAGAAGKRQKR